MLAKNFTLEEPSEYFTMWRMQIRNVEIWQLAKA